MIHFLGVALFLLPLVGFVASRRRRPPRIRFRMISRTVRIFDRPHQILTFTVVGRNGTRLVLDTLMLDRSDGGALFDVERANRHQLRSRFRLFRNAWRDHVLPNDWRKRRAARLQRMAFRRFQ